MRGIYFYFSLLLTISLVSCRSVSHLSSRDIPIKRISTQKLLKSVSDSQLDFEYLNISKFAAKFSHVDDTKNFKGSLRLKEDSTVFMSIAPLMGIEMFRLILHEDSLYFIDRYNKNYFIGDYDFINNKLNFNFELGLIENLLCGQLYSYNYKKSPEKALKHYKTRIEDNFYILETPDKRRFDEVYCLYKIDSNFNIKSGFLKDLNNGYELTFNYDDFISIDHHFFPTKVSISINSADAKYRIDLDYKKIVTSKKLSFPFNVSSKYTKIDF